MSFIKASDEDSGNPNQKFSETEQSVVKLDSTENVLPRSLDSYSTVINFHGEKLTITPNQASHPIIDHPRLSLREAEVLQFLANGLTPEQTALEMDIKVRTVRKYLDNLRRKFNTGSRDQLMARAGYLRLCDPYKITSRSLMNPIE